MIYSYSVIPLLIVFLLLSFFSLNIKAHLQKHQALFVFIAAIVALNILSWILQLKTHYTMTDIYAIFLLLLLFLFMDPRSVEMMRRPILFLLLLNLFCCAVETQFGFMSFYVNIFTDLYTSTSEFLTSKIGLISNTQSIIRRINDYVFFVRPSGLFSNLHLSSFGLFCLFAFLNIEKKALPLQLACVFLIVIGGTMQTMLCLIIYFFLCSMQNFKRVALVLFLLIVPFGLYAVNIYGPQRSNEYNNMYRIVIDSLGVFKTLPIKTLIWGNSVDEIISSSGANFAHGNMLIESGILRYSLSFGFLNIALILALLCWIYFKLKPADRKPYYFLIATLGTYFHYFMTTTFVGSILVTFIFMSQQQQNSLVQDESMN